MKRHFINGVIVLYCKETHFSYVQPDTFIFFVILFLTLFFVLYGVCCLNNCLFNLFLLPGGHGHEATSLSRVLPVCAAIWH